MGLLNFLAMEPPQRASIIQKQARDALGPFERYLFQARKNAEERQKRHRFAFEVVRRKHIYRLQPLDTLVILHPPSRKCWLLEGWPDQRDIDLDRKLNNIEQEVYIPVEAAMPTEAGLKIEIDSEQLVDGDRIEWCGQQCVARRPTAPGRPQSVTTVDGQTLAVRWSGRIDEEDAVCLEGASMQRA